MAIISTTSVGSVNYYLVDDIPNHVAPKGSVALVSNNIYAKSLTYINNDGSTTWLKCIDDSSKGQTLRFSSATQISYASLTEGSWYTIASSWVYNNMDNFWTELNRGRLYYTGDTVIKSLTHQANTIIGGADKWIEFSVGPLKNSATPINFNNGNTFDNSGMVNVGTKTLTTMKPNDYYVSGFSPITREGGGSGPNFTLRHYELNTTKLDEAIDVPLVDENFESGGFTTNGWTVVNGAQTNKWIVNTGTSYNGTYSAYISSGTAVSYNVGAASTVHFYKDFTFPTTFTTPSGVIKNISNCFLDFRWKCVGENSTAAATNYDYGTVVLTTTATTPVAGTEVSTVLATAGGNGRIGGDDTYGKFNLGYVNLFSGNTSDWQLEYIDLTSWLGTTKRLVFTWKNDGSLGSNPPMCIDNIRLRYSFF